MALCLAPTAFAQSVVLSEIRVDEPGFDLSEYVELAGVAGTSLNGLSIVVVGDGDAGSPNGVVESVIALSGSIGASGRFLVAEATFSFAATPDLFADFELESSDNTTFFLVSGFTGGVGTDLDANDDGTMDSTPWTTLLSSVALVRNASPDGVTEEYFYSATTVGPEAGDSPAHAYLCADSAAWKAGALDPASGSDTPGAANAACGSVISMVFSELRTKQPGADNDEYVEFVGTPGASLAGLTYVVIGDRAASGTTPADYVGHVEMALPLDGAVVPADGRLVIAEPTVTFPLVVDWVTPTDGLMFEDNSTSRTHLVVAGWSGAVDTDLDTNNDGTLDATPWLSVIAGVAFEGPFATDRVYSANVIPKDETSTGTFTAGHAYTCDPTGNWTVGAFTFYTGGGDTPGAVNRDCSAGPVLECGEATAGACDAEHATPFCSDTNCCNAVCIVDPTCCNEAWDAACVTQAATSCAAATSSCEFVDARINEIRIDMAGTDTLEFVEIAGTPGLSVNDLTLIIIGDGSSGTSLSGFVERVRPLTGVSIPADGTLLIGNPATNPDVGNGAGAAGANLNNDWIENSDNITIMLVRGFTGAISTDLDTNDDGTLDLTPWVEVVDSIALVESATVPPIGTEYAYGANRIGPDGAFVPGHVWRCQDTGCWNIGLFDIVANTAAGNETPGSDSVDCDTATCAGDFNDDGARDGADLGIILAGWGTSSGDMNDDGITDGADLGAFLAVFGLPCN
ncbi:MAG: hypothetical protein DWH90_00165 [Planctomycetota bacterium]|nr:MAG: hypothetical protein DWH90_00165 [Planctomycetota bacterium]